VLIPAASSSGDAVVNPFAGTWSTFNGSGTLTMQAVDSATGQTAVQADGGGAGCGAPTVWYAGSYQAGSDTGQVAGCTNSTGQHLSGWYRSSAGQRHGTISISIGSDLASFSGEYDELSSMGSGTGPYAGTFSSDFDSSGRTTTPQPSVAIVPAPAQWGGSTSETSLAPQSGVVLESPTIGANQQDATVTLPVDQKTAIALVAQNGAQKPGDCVYAALGLTLGLSSNDTPDKYTLAPGFDSAFAFFFTMAECLDHLGAAQGLASTGAATPCPVRAARIKQLSGPGRRYRLLGRDPKPPIVVSCSRSGSRVVLHIKTRGRGRSLHAIVGQRLLVGLYRSPKAHAKAKIKATFSAH
jgi:hypothetical protein